MGKDRKNIFQEDTEMINRWTKYIEMTSELIKKDTECHKAKVNANKSHLNVSVEIH